MIFAEKNRYSQFLNKTLRVIPTIFQGFKTGNKFNQEFSCGTFNGISCLNRKYFDTQVITLNSINKNKVIVILPLYLLCLLHVIKLTIVLL